MNNHIAILCIAHVIDDNFKLLVRQLSSDFDIYVHFDKKNEPFYQREIEEIKHLNVNFVNNVKVYWGGFSQILCEYNLLKEAFNSDKKYSHYLLISGADFPLKSNQQICSFFQQHKSTSFLEIKKLPHPSWGFDGGMDRVKRFWFTEFKKRKITKVLGRITLMTQRVLGIQRKLFFGEYYGGANWADLSHNAVKYILEYLETNPNALKSFIKTRSSDEIWKQTILKTSDNNLIIDKLLRYTDWRKGPQFPRTLDETDYESLRKSDALFARKFNGKDLTLQKIILKGFDS
ncbi:beta-1,6-N-acetylglucosaminyltransferase [Capnocytophaga cynodegmi]|uniref:beta-1,6-N-acetylglucosaminyltransferase n=1 Tax=Capnocytophaga cynodegmi TaxID=28189 RepID=UPI00385E9957